MYTVSTAINSQEEMAALIKQLHENSDLYKGGTLTLEQTNVPGETNKLTLEITVIS